MKLTNLVIAFGLFTLLVSCNSKFDKVKWTKHIDGDYPERDDMLDDLIKNNQLKGISYRQLVDLLGKPDYDKDDNVYYYQIVVDFGHDIDPVYVKNLELQLNKDSVVNNYYIKEYKH